MNYAGTIIQDSREQKPLDFTENEVEVKKLEFGDYAPLGHELACVAERKSVADLCGSFDFKNRERFRRELARMQEEAVHYFIVVDGNQSDVFENCKRVYKIAYCAWISKKRSGIKCRPPMRPEVRLAGILGSIEAIYGDYNIVTHFTGGREESVAFILKRFGYFTRESKSNPNIQEEGNV